MAELKSPLRKDKPYWVKDQDPTGHNQAFTIRAESVGLNGFDVHVDRLAANTPYRQTNFIPLVTRAPGVYQFHKRGKDLLAFLQRLVEEWPSEWSGLDLKQSIDTQATKIGLDDQSITSVTRVTNPEITVSLKGPEVANRSVSKFLEYHLHNFVKSPSSQFPALDMVDRAALGDYLLDMNTWDVILIELDHARKNVVDAIWLLGCTLTDLPNHELKRSNSEGDKVEEVTWQFKAYSKRGVGILRAAQKFADDMKIWDVNYMMTPAPYTEIDGNLDAEGGNGNMATIKKMASEYK